MDDYRSDEPAAPQEWLRPGKFEGRYAEMEKGRVRVSRACILFYALTLCLACASDPARPSRLLLATGTPGGTYNRIGEDLARYLRRSGFRIPVEPVATRGTEDNLDRLRRGEVDLALVTQDALTREAENLSQDLCVVGPLYRGAAQFVLRKALVRTGTVADLKGVHFYPGSGGSGTERSTLELLDALGIQPDLVPQPQRTMGYDASAEALAGGKFDAVALSGGPPVDAVTSLMKNYPRRFVLLKFSDEEIGWLGERLPGIYASSIPDDTYPGQTGPVPSVGKQTVLVARAGLDSVVLKSLSREIAKGIDQENKGLHDPRVHLLLRNLTPEFWRQPLNVPRCAEGD